MYEWREGLKKGDKVVKRKYSKIFIVEVESITKAGSVKFSDGDLVKRDSGWSRDNYSIEEFTDNTTLQLERQNNIERFKKMKDIINSDCLTNEELEMINNILDKNVFVIRSILGDYLINENIEEEIITSKDQEKAFKFKYDEAVNLAISVGSVKNLMYNVYCNGYRVR